MVHMDKARGHPVPPGVTAIVSNGRDRSIYVLYKDYQVIVIQLPARKDRLLDPNVQITKELLEAGNRRHYEEVEKIHMLLDRIEFGKSNWVYAVERPKGGLELVHKERRKFSITCPTWARLIPRRDIQFTKFWVGWDTWHGVWNGHEVDCLVAFEDWELENLERYMRAYTAMQRLDLTYHVYGHLVEDDGTVVGIVQEPHVGRLMQYRDRSIVYDAYARLQHLGLIYCAASEYENTHILNGKVRLPALYTVWWFPDAATCKLEGDLRYWGPLKERFKWLKTCQSDPARQVIYRECESTPELLARFSPERPLFLSLTTPMFMSEKPGTRYKELQDWIRETEKSLTRKSLTSRDSTSSRSGIVRRERASHIDGHYSRDSRRKMLTSSDDTTSDFSLIRCHVESRPAIRAGSPFSDADSEKTAVDHLAALAVTAQFLRPVLFQEVYEHDHGSESDSDVTLMASEILSPLISR
ncbi:hypothetical protein H0H92_010296 [Tricholoma furcatifolium]|nr:hypothetical protein H0H92_010296 [Tricholoma furcatifolium]